MTEKKAAPATSEMKPAALAMDKEQTRQLVLQVSGFLKIFGGAYPRLRAIAALLDVEAKPEIWSVIWNALSADPQAIAALVIPFHEGTADFKGLGTQSDQGASFLSFVADAGNRGSDYYQTKAAISGILMMAYGLASMTRTTRDDEAVRLTMQMFQQYFDEFWDSQHGAAASGR